MSERVTIPCTTPCSWTRTAGFDLESSLTTLSTGWSDDIIGNGESIISLTAVSSSFGFSRLFCDNDQSLTEPTQLAPSMTGSCDTSCSVMSPIAWRTLAPGATLTTAGDRKSTRLNSSHGYI